MLWKKVMKPKSCKECKHQELQACLGAAAKAPPHMMVCCMRGDASRCDRPVMTATTAQQSICQPEDMQATMSPRGPYLTSWTGS